MLKHTDHHTFRKHLQPGYSHPGGGNILIIIAIVGGDPQSPELMPSPDPEWHGVSAAGIQDSFPMVLYHLGSLGIFYTPHKCVE